MKNQLVEDSGSYIDNAAPSSCVFDAQNCSSLEMRVPIQKGDRNEEQSEFEVSAA